MTAAASRFGKHNHEETKLINDFPSFINIAFFIAKPLRNGFRFKLFSLA